MSRSAITHDGRDIDRTPTCRGDWDDWVSASSTRNHVLDDPLLDWLDRHGPAKGFAPNPIDQRTDFLEFVFRKASEFERAVTAHIASLVPGDMDRAAVVRLGAQIHGLTTVFAAVGALCSDRLPGCLSDANRSSGDRCGRSAAPPI